LAKKDGIGICRDQPETCPLLTACNPECTLHATMKRAIFSVVCVVIGVGGMVLWVRRVRVVDAGWPSTAAVDGVDAVMDPLASLAAVERAAAEAAVPGTPSSIPAIPSIPAIGIRLQR
jgi:hypothetical protein